MNINIFSSLEIKITNHPDEKFENLPLNILQKLKIMKFTSKNLFFSFSEINATRF